MSGMPADARMPAGNDVEAGYGDRQLEHSEVSPSVAQQSLGYQCDEINGAYGVEKHVKARQGNRNIPFEPVLAQGCVDLTHEAASGRRNQQMVMAAQVLQDLSSLKLEL